LTKVVPLSILEENRLRNRFVRVRNARQLPLHLYTLVKDLRTGYETGNASAVLDGDLDPFIEAYLRQAPVPVA
jgi:peptide chain release factor 2